MMYCIRTPVSPQKGNEVIELARLCPIGAVLYLCMCYNTQPWALLANFPMKIFGKLHVIHEWPYWLKNLFPDPDCQTDVTVDDFVEHVYQYICLTGAASLLKNKREFLKRLMLY